MLRLEPLSLSAITGLRRLMPGPSLILLLLLLLAPPPGSIPLGALCPADGAGARRVLSG